MRTTAPDTHRGRLSLADHVPVLSMGILKYLLAAGPLLEPGHGGWAGGGSVPLVGGPLPTALELLAQSAVG